VDTGKIGTLEVSRIALGCGSFGTEGCDESQAVEVVHAALDAGITLFDTADVYGERGRSETYLGRALGSRRGDVVIATKFRQPMRDDGTGQGASARWIEQAFEGSLRRLGTDRIDLYQQHAPDPDVSIEETLTALDRLVQAGKVVEIGTSNVDAGQIAEAAAKAPGARFASVQNHYSLITRTPEEGVLDACAEHGLGFLAYFPLEYGVLTGKYERGVTPPPGTRMGNLDENFRRLFMRDEVMDRVDALRSLADSWGRTLAQLAIAWVLAQQGVTSVLVGASRPSHVGPNAEAARWRMTPDELAAVDAALASARTSL
jgi:aryl-alcohol dehydrogenase-like predicted oxidoreductase